MKTKVYKEIASRLLAMKNCQESDNQEWYSKHQDIIQGIVNHGPSGSTICGTTALPPRGNPMSHGIDCGTNLDWDSSKTDKLVFYFSFHHMDETGMYDGWTEHRLTVKPSLIFDIYLSISGQDKNGIKEYLYQVYEEWLNSEIDIEA